MGVVNIQVAGMRHRQRSTVPIIVTSGHMEVFPPSLRWPLLSATLITSVLVVIHNDDILPLEGIQLALQITRLGDKCLLVP